MPCACTHPSAPRVNLVDGTVACTWCEAWRHECEARHIMSLPTLAARRAYLFGRLNEHGRLAGGIAQKRGPEALQRLQTTMTALWQQRQAQAKAAVLSRERAPANDSHERKTA